MLFSLGRAFWNACVPPRMSFFLWLTCGGKTLITDKDNLGNRGMCKEHEECGYWLISSSTTRWLKNCGHWFFRLSGVSWLMTFCPWWSFYHVGKDTLAREVNGTIWKMYPSLWAITISSLKIWENDTLSQIWREKKILFSSYQKKKKKSHKHSIDQILLN